ncbi:MAG: 4Fe-4S dicluster domain-containing protein [Rhodomicrobium sp.]|nr:4Fe-4S dicluster domain-containing protein [Rhodomicrobium sp.]
MKTYLDWSAYDTYGIGDAYSGIPATGGNYAKAVAVCMRSHDCRKAGKGLMCPSFRVTGDPAHTTESRVAAFKAALNGEFGDRPFGDKRLAQAMDLCVSCKGCKKECPSAVDVTLIKTEYLAHRNAALGTPLRSWLFANLPRWTGYYRPLLRLVIGLRNGSRLLASLVQAVTGISAASPLPQPAKRPFAPPAVSVQKAPRGDVLLFADTFSTHFEPEIANAAVEVLSAAGYRVRTLRPVPDDPEPGRALCCGRTYLTHGLVEQARREGRRVLAALRPAIEAKTPIIGLEPSCLLSLRDELYCLGLGAEVGELGKQLFLFEEFLVKEQARGLRLPLKQLPATEALVHGHCHQKAFGTMKAMRKVLGSVPGLSYGLIETSCCGMAGSFGLEAEHYEASQAMAGLSLLPALRAAPAETRVIANGFSCRQQIANGSGRAAIHIALLLREALDEDEGV